MNDGGKFICLTLAESHVLGMVVKNISLLALLSIFLLVPTLFLFLIFSDLLLPKFRFGWKMSLNAVGPEPPSQPLKLQTFMFVAEKDSTSDVSDILSYLGEYSVENNQVEQFDLVIKPCNPIDSNSFKKKRTIYFEQDFMQSIF